MIDRYTFAGSVPPFTETWPVYSNLSIYRDQSQKMCHIKVQKAIPILFSSLFCCCCCCCLFFFSALLFSNYYFGCYYRIAFMCHNQIDSFSIKCRYIGGIKRACVRVCVHAHVRVWCSYLLLSLRINIYPFSFGIKMLQFYRWPVSTHTHIQNDYYVFVWSAWNQFHLIQFDLFRFCSFSIFSCQFLLVFSLILVFCGIFHPPPLSLSLFVDMILFFFNRFYSGSSMRLV